MKKIVVPAMLLVLVMMVSGCSNEMGDVLAPEDGSGNRAFNGKVNSDSGVLPPDSNPHGMSYGDWSMLAWQWLAAAPLDHNPGLDETGEDMDYGQSGHVWYMVSNFTGGTTTRTGVVPAGRRLFISLIGFEASTREGHGETEEELRGTAAYVMDLVTDLSCEIDGVPVQDPELYRFQSTEMFSLTVPEDNVFDLWGIETPAGTYYPSVADGYYLMLAPLSAGEHTIHWSAAIPEFEYYPDITYNITVEGGRPDGHRNTRQ